MQQRRYFDQAAEALTRAMGATGLAEQERLLDETLRLNRLALAEETQNLRESGAGSLSAPGEPEELP